MLPISRCLQSLKPLSKYFLEVIWTTLGTLAANNRKQKSRNMNSNHNPFGVLSNMGPGETPRYAPIGIYSYRYGHFIQPGGAPGYRYNDRVIVDPRWPSPRAYSGGAMDDMRGQLQYGGDENAFAWHMSMMSDAEQMREWSRYA